MLTITQDTILMQDLFKFRPGPRGEDGRNGGELAATGLRPKFLDKLGEKGVEIPAKAFRPPAQNQNGAGGRVPNGRPVPNKVPKITQLVRPERAR